MHPEKKECLTVRFIAKDNKTALLFATEYSILWLFLTRKLVFINKITMIRFIITTAFFLVIALLGYNYFYGTAQEKEQAQEIFSKGAEVVGAGADLLKSEYQKFQGGKYDEALNNINNLLSKVKEQGGELHEEIDSWKQRKEHWDQKQDDLRILLNSDSDFINEEKVKKAIAALEQEREVLEGEGKRLKEKAE